MQWFQKFKNAKRQTKWFILNWFIYGIVLIAATAYVYTRLGSAAFKNSSQDSEERGDARSKRSGLNEKGMAKAMPDEEDRSGKAAAGRSPDELLKIADNVRSYIKTSPTQEMTKS